MIYICFGALIGLLTQEKSLYSSFFAVYFLLMGTVLSLLYFWCKKKDYLNRILVPALLFSFAAAFFIVRGQFMNSPLETPPSLYHKQSFVFTVEDRKEEDLYTRYSVAFTRGENVYTAYLRTDLFPKYEIGDMLTATTSLDRREGVILNEDISKSFNYDEFLHEKGIVGVISFPKITKIGESDETWQLYFAKKRELFENKIHQYIPLPEGNLVSAMIFGSHSLTKSENKLFQKAGISHIVALSGFNITIIISFLAVLFFFVPFWPRLLVNILLVSFYLCMTEMSGSLLRASIMALITTFALMRGNIADGRKVFLLSTLILAFLFPESFLHDASLHLSLLAMISVLFVYPAVFEKYAARYSGFRKIFLELFLATLTVTLLIAPYASVVFGKLTIYGIIATLFVTFFVPFITILGIVLILTSLTLPFLATILSLPVTLCAHFIFVVARAVSSLPFASISTSLSFSSAFLCYSFILIVTIFCMKRNEGRKEKSLETQSSTASQNESEIIEGVIRF